MLPRPTSVVSAFACALFATTWPLYAGGAVSPAPEEFAQAGGFVTANFLATTEQAPAAEPPFSFTYNAKPSTEFLGGWKTTRQSRKLDEHRTAHTVIYADPATGLSVRCEAIAYDDFPTVEWTVYFQNTRPVPLTAAKTT